jgi:hypothetical protein
LLLDPSSTSAPNGVSRRVVSAEVICIGDSWLTDSRANLAGELAAVHTGQNIISIAAPGVEAADLADPGQPYLHKFRQALKRNSSGLQRIYISAGWDNLGSLLLSDCSQCVTPDECFDVARMSHRFSRIYTDLSVLIKLVQELAPEAQVRLHNYDYAIPDGRAEYRHGKWLKVPLHLHRVPDDGSLARGSFRREVVTTLVDTFGEWLRHLCEQHSNAKFCRTAGTLNDDEWQDEMHPTAAGYRKIAAVLTG